MYSKPDRKCLEDQCDKNHGEHSLEISTDFEHR